LIPHASASTIESAPQPVDLRVRRHIPALDGLRGIAVLMVMAEHLGGGRQSSHLALRLLGDSTRIGWAGVTLFFVLSGFLITGILWDSFKESGWWQRFYMRRSLRIFPLYYLSLLYALIVALLFAHVMLRTLPVYALYLQDIPWLNSLIRLVPEHVISLSAFWSLAVEEQFYLIWPFLLFSLRNRRGVAMNLCLGGVLASLIFRLAVLHFQWDMDWCYRSLPGRAGELLIGAWIALAVRGSMGEQKRLLRLVPVTLAVSFLSLVAIGLWTRGSLETDEPMWLGIGLLALALFFASALVSCLRPGLVEKIVRSRILRWFGAISYGMYVFQSILNPAFRMAVQPWIQHFPGELQELAKAVTSFAGVTCIAWLSFHTFERYFLRIKDRLHSQRETANARRQP
jgi:peptidoglycan/LPS O-acetylase OafA/YrhL